MYKNTNMCYFDLKLKYWFIVYCNIWEVKKGGYIHILWYKKSWSYRTALLFLLTTCIGFSRRYLLLRNNNFFTYFAFRCFYFGNKYSRIYVFYWNSNILLILIFNFPSGNGLTQNIVKGHFFDISIH